VKGYRANLSNVCGCEVEIVGKDKAQLIDNFVRHYRDVHGTTVMPWGTKSHLDRAIETLVSGLRTAH